MTHYTFFYLLSVSIAFIGSFYLAKGILWLTPKFIFELSRTKFGGNPFLAESFVKQKSDYVCGIVFLFIALFIQLVVIFMDSNLLIFNSIYVGIIIYLIIIIMIIIISIFFRKSLGKKFDSSVREYWEQNM